MILNAIMDFINKISSKLVAWVYGLLLTFPGWLQLVILLGGAVLIVFGAIALVKKSFKLIFVLGGTAAVIFVLYWIFLKK